MTREEVQHLLMMIDATYPNFKVDDVKTTIEAWTFLLSDYLAYDIDVAFKTYVTTQASSFAPSVAQLIELSRKPKELAGLSDAESWAIVRKAIGRGNYYAEQDFAEFPEVIKKAVGSPSQLRMWAMDSDFNEGVESSNFYKRLNREKDREKFINDMPQEMRTKLEAYQNNLLIEVSDEKITC